jgi:hypothetical protein
VDGEVLDLRPDGAVLIRTQVGEILGKWADGKYPVRVGQRHSFEFDFDFVLTSAHRAGPGSWGDWAVGVSGDSTQVRGRLDQVDDDGMGYLRLGEDSVSMIETDGSLDEGTMVSFSVSWTGLALWSIGGSLTRSRRAFARRRS